MKGKELPILISKKEGQTIFLDDYKIGWLMKDNKSLIFSGVRYE